MVDYLFYSVNDSIAKYLNVFDLEAKILELKSNLLAEIEQFKILNPKLENSKLLDFSDLFIIEFSQKLN